MTITHLAGYVQVDGLAGGGHVAEYADAPGYLHLVVVGRVTLLHAVRQQKLAAGAAVHVEDFGDEAPSSAAPRRTVHQEQGRGVAVEQHAQVVDDLVRQRPEVQVGGDVPDHRQEKVPFALGPPQIPFGVHAMCRYGPPGQPYLGVDEQRQHANRTRR